MRPDRPLIYLAAPLFNERERLFNQELAQRLERWAPVFLPQRDGALLVDMVEAGVSQDVAERRVFEQDTAAMRSAQLLIAVLDGGHIDEGVAFELGFMHALGKPCIGLQTDVRRALPTGNNPMISRALTVTFSETESLMDWAAEEVPRLLRSVRTAA